MVMDRKKDVTKKITHFLLIILVACFAACSGSGGSGTEDYRPLTEYNSGPSAEEPGGNINYPDGYIPPAVTIKSPPTGMVISLEQKNIEIRGTLKQGEQKIVTLLINGNDVKISADNKFSTEISLPDDLEPFVAIEASAIDAKGYAGRDRIVILRGASVASGQKVLNAVGAIIDQGVLNMPARFDEVIKDLLDNAIGKKEFNTDYIRIEVTKPFKAVLDLKLTSIDIKTDNDVAIKGLSASKPDPNDNDKAGLNADMNLKGIEIGADVKFISIGSLNLSGLADTKVVLELENFDADLALKMGVKEVTGLGIDVSRLNLNIKELQADIPSMIILTRLLDGLGISHDEYYLKLPVKGWLAKIVSEALNKIVNENGLGLIVYIPPVSLDVDTLMPEKGSNTLIDSIKGIRDLIVGAELEKFMGSTNSIGIMAALSGRPKKEKNTGIISLPPSITLAQALKAIKDDNIDFTAAAISADSINAMLAALNDSGFGLSLDIGGLIPNLGLPADMKADVMFGGPPFIDFRDGKIKLFVPNLKTGLYINSSRQLEVAVDLAIEIETEVINQGGNPYLTLNLKLNEFNIYYLADRLGLEKAIDIERAVKNLMPQILELLKPWLDKTPLVINDAKAKELLTQLNKDNSKLMTEICNDLPGFEISLMWLNADSGYLAVGINVK
jgi:hypothetical protein